MNTTLMIATGIIFFAVVVILVLYAVRRSTTMSEDLSTQWEEKLKTIRPAPTLQKDEPLKDKQTYPLADQRERDSISSYTLLQGELRENKTRLQNCLQEIVTLKQNETTVQRDIQNLRTEVGALQERLRTSQGEIKGLRASIDEGAKPQKEPPARDIPTLNAQPVESANPPIRRERHSSGIFRSLFQRRACPTCSRRLGSNDKYCDSCGRLVSPII